eukprot:COSAG03_NODE_100_length_12949_cov_130.139611_11_plen_43_part_00
MSIYGADGEGEGAAAPAATAMGGGGGTVVRYSMQGILCRTCY